mmetsp:Transcript_2416/g.3501  ORF Transcript_2416/g.3501 Transcript_2416/m.3501 type:complete len:185 (+) Transcript_2416:348-902(+)|eukprot:CAMPEP_0184489280 /NCGR_PEP_ID=MMETSP0113_2-20130426/14972_1 /TAXON_ID=91329 /ORGANISM="Norrisiella sphaerica, Strain BC52" /LENGTH=184 /DNA_ID=CAMNT_0026872603 /DNA_START=281 /DNA_END=835 /DNA_ORIENTATION=+
MSIVGTPYPVHPAADGSNMSRPGTAKSPHTEELAIKWKIDPKTGCLHIFGDLPSPVALDDVKVCKDVKEKTLTVEFHDPSRDSLHSKNFNISKDFDLNRITVEMNGNTLNVVVMPAVFGHRFGQIFSFSSLDSTDSGVGTPNSPASPNGQNGMDWMSSLTTPTPKTLFGHQLSNGSDDDLFYRS